MSPSIRRTFAFLCLALSLVLGVAPSGGLTLCVEADGCVTVALTASAEHCVGCDPHAESEPATGLDAGHGCPCADIAVVRSTDNRWREPHAVATVVIGGLVTSTSLTLVVLPAFYRAFAARVAVARGA